MKSSILLTLLAAGSLFVASAQQTSQPNQPANQEQNQTAGQAKGIRPHYRMMGGAMVQRLSKRFNLTPDQQTQARTIFQQARQQSQGLKPQLQSEHQAMRAAIKSDNETQIDQIARQDANVNSRALAIHTKAMARFYSILTPDQKAQFDQMGANRRAAHTSQQAS